MGDGRRHITEDEAVHLSADRHEQQAASKLHNDAYGKTDKSVGGKGDASGSGRKGDTSKAEGDKLQDATDKPAVLVDTPERERVARLQDLLHKVLLDGNRDLTEKLKKERERGEFGPATRRAYEEAIKSLKSDIADTLANLDKQALPIPPGCPVPLPRDKSGLPVIDGYYRSLISTHRLAPDINFDTDSAPSSRDLDRLTNIALWLSDASGSMSSATRKFESEQLIRAIEKLNRPGWGPPRDGNLDQWYQAAASMVDLTMKVRNYAETISSLHKAGGEFPDGGIKPENFPGTLKFDDKGKIVDIKLDLPEDLRQTPENMSKIKRLQDWLDKYHERVDQAITEITRAADNENRLLIWQDIGGSGTVKLEKDGKVISPLVKDRIAGEEKKFNLTECRFDVESLPDGRIKVTNSRQFQYSHWYNYQDIGADDIGKPVKGEERIYNPYDFVPVVKGGKIEIMRADQLSSWRHWQMAKHYGEKIATGLLDVGMLLTGTIEVGAAVKAARMGELAFRAAVGQALKGSFRVALGATGFLNNAEVRESDIGRNFLLARSVVMLTDVTYGLGKSTWGFIKGAKAAEEAGSASSIVQNTIKQSKWATTAMKGSEAGFAIADCIYMPIIGGHIWGQIDTLRGKDQKPHLDDAKHQHGGGMGNQEQRAGTRKPADMLQASRDVLGGYATTLEIQDKGARVRVESLTKATKAALSLPESDQQRVRQRQDLAEAFHSAATEEERVAAACGLLYLSRKTDGSLPESIAVKSSADGAATGNQEIKTQEVIKLLEKQAADSQSGSVRLVAGEMLLRLGRISGQEFAGLCQDILISARSSKELKMRAMVDANGPRLGALLDGIRSAEASGLSGKTAHERRLELASGYGLSSPDLEKTLLAVAGKQGEDPDVRAMAISVLHAVNRSNVQERNELLQRCGDTWKAVAGQAPGSYARAFIASMNADMGAQADPLDGNADQVVARKYLAAVALAQLQGEGYSQQGINKALVESLSPTNPDIALQALRALLPDRIKQLSTSEATAVRMEALNLLNQPNSASSERTKIAILGMLKPLLDSADDKLKGQMARALESTLNQSDSNYAGAHPDLRQAAIGGLADIGSRASIPILLQHLNAASEPSAPVRLAAIEALEKLHAPNLRRAALELVDLETDPAVAARVRAIDSSTRDLDPNSAEYKEAYKKAEADLRKATTRSLSDSQDWIRRSYPLLDGENFRIESQRRANEIYGHFGGNAHYLWDALTHWDTDIDDKKWEKARQDVRREVEEQMASLVSRAKGSGVEAEQARRALTYLVLSNGRGFLDGWRDWAVRQAANGLYDICQPGAPGRESIAWAVESTLMNQPKMDCDARATLLHGLSWLVYRQPATVSGEEAARTVAAALDLEYRAMPKQGEPGYEASKKLQLEMLDALKSYNNPKVTPVLEAMSEEHPMPEVKKAAGELFTKFKTTLTPAAAEAAADPQARARAQTARVLDQRPDLTKRQYKEEFEKAKADLVKSCARSTEKSQDWLKSAYPLLDGEAYNQRYRLRVAAVYAGFWGTLDYAFSRKSANEREWKKAGDEVVKEVEGQFKNLVKLAQQNEGRSDDARKALIEIIHTNGRPFLEGWRDWAVGEASTALFELCKPGAPGRGDVVWAIETCLINEPEMSRTAKLNVLYGLAWLADANPPAISGAEAAVTVAAALQQEYSSMPKPDQPGYQDSKKLQLEMLRQLSSYGHKKIYPLLEAMADSHPDPELRAKADELIGSMRDQVGVMRQQTTPDIVTPLEKRAENLGEALKTKDVTAMCQAIFDACQSLPIRSSEDPRVPVLQSALSDSSERVQLSAAWMLLESSNPGDQGAALDALARLSVSGTRLGYRKDANSLLDGVRSWGASYDRAVTRKIASAKAAGQVTR